MPIDVLMPALSPTMEEGTLAKWHVKAGDAVRSGDVIAEIETDKATMEVEAVDEGTVEEILVAEGTEGVKVNAAIARLSGEGEPAKAAEPETSESKTEPAAAEQNPVPSTTSRSPSPVKDGGGSDGAKSSPEERSGTGEGDRAPRGGGGEGRAPASRETGQRIFASPLARRLAEQRGIDLAGVTGSGPHGRIVKADIDAAKPGAAPAPKAASAQAPAAAPTAAPAAEHHTLAQLGIPDGTYDLVPLDGMKKTIAKRMTESFRDVPHFPLTVDIELDALLAARAKINAGLEKEGVKVSVNDLVIKATASALMRVREANASYSPEGIAMHHDADVAMAVAIDGGLITPIIRKAQGKGLAQIATEAKDLAERARARKLKPEEFQGGTFTVSNLGMFGIKSFASIINQPQGCILSVGVGEKRPVVKNDALAIATVMSVTLTCDHRVVDGAIGARWLSVFKAMIEDPMTMLV